MSKYTTEVRFICEEAAGLSESVGVSDVQETIKKAVPKIFWNSIEMFDEEYKNVLFPKILLHYYTREIGLETVGLWKLKLNTKLVEILPFYNEMYKSALEKFNPFYDVDITRDHKGKGDTSSVGEASSSSRSKNINKFSDTPQGSLKNIESNEYLSSATIDENNGSSNGNNKALVNSTDEWVEHVKGKQGGQSYSKLLKEYRSTILNIDMMVINDLSNLFMNIW